MGLLFSLRKFFQEKKRTVAIYSVFCTSDGQTKVRADVQTS